MCVHSVHPLRVGRSLLLLVSQKRRHHHLRRQLRYSLHCTRCEEERQCACEEEVPLVTDFEFHFYDQEKKTTRTRDRNRRNLADMAKQQRNEHGFRVGERENVGMRTSVAKIGLGSVKSQNAKRP